jgi:GNAT superfamily N-acetyltransferase
MTSKLSLLKIDLATKNDVAHIADLHATSWRHAYRGALSDTFLAGDIVQDRLILWSQRLHQLAPNRCILVARLHNTVVGFACVEADCDTQWGTLLDNLHVTPELHGQGVGTLLMKQVASWCNVNAHSRQLFLWVLQSNNTAQQFYLRLGARNEGSDVWQPPGGGAVPRFRFAWHDINLINGPPSV